MKIIVSNSKFHVDTLQRHCPYLNHSFVQDCKPLPRSAARNERDAYGVRILVDDKGNHDTVYKVLDRHYVIQ